MQTNARTGGGLVEEEDGGVGEQLRGHRHALPLAARDAADERVGPADERVRAPLQAHVQKDLLHLLPLVVWLHVLRHTHHGVELQVLPHRQRREEEVVLVHVRC